MALLSDSRPSPITGRAIALCALDDVWGAHVPFWRRACIAIGFWLLRRGSP